MNAYKNVEFVKSAMSWQDTPNPPLPEIAFVGRSNVGKSSLINMLINRKNLARVSKQPGKTRSINFFKVDEDFYLVDLPGYGFARTSKAEQDDWQRAIEGYLLNSPQLKNLFLLIDSKVGVKKNDEQLVEWLQYNKVPFSIVATKTDRISKTEQIKQAKAICNMFGINIERDLVLSSSKNKLGRGAIWGAIKGIIKRS